MGTKKSLTAALMAAALVACLSVTGCAPKTTSESTAGSGDETPVVEVEWSPDADCMSCHAKEASSLDAVHSVALEGITTPCVSCHLDEVALSSAHEGVTTESSMPTKLENTEVGAGACLACHGTLEAIAEKTATNTVLTDKNGTVANPHALPATDGHAAISCSDCHKMHSGKNAQATAPRVCSSCHHAGVYECGTCHEKMS